MRIVLKKNYTLTVRKDMSTAVQKSFMIYTQWHLLCFIGIKNGVSLRAKLKRHLFIQHAGNPRIPIRFVRIVKQILIREKSLGKKAQALVQCQLFIAADVVNPNLQQRQPHHFLMKLQTLSAIDGQPLSFVPSLPISVVIRKYVMTREWRRISLPSVWSDYASPEYLRRLARLTN